MGRHSPAGFAVAISISERLAAAWAQL